MKLFPRYSRRKTGPSRWAVFVMLLTLLMAQPTPAHANLATASNQIVEIANQIRQLYYDVRTELYEIGATLRELQIIAELVAIFNIINFLYNELGFADVVQAALKRLENEAHTRRIQALIESGVQNTRAGNIGDVVAAHTLPENSAACAIGRLAAAQQMLTVAQNSMTNRFIDIVNQKDTGKNANPNGTGAVGDFINLCKIGFLKKGVDISEQDFAKYKCRELTGEDERYLYAHTNVYAVLHPTVSDESTPGAMQYPMPSSAGFTQDGHMTFTGDDGNISAKGDELAFLGAFKNCELRQREDVQMTPPNTMGPEGIRTAASNVASSIERSQGVAECMEAVAWLTRHPQSTKNIFKASDGTSIYDVELATCKRLRAKLPNGIGLDPNTPSLKNCDKNGLSKAEAQRLEVNRDSDPVYRQALFGMYPADKALDEINRVIPAQRQVFEQKLEKYNAAVAVQRRPAAPRQETDATRRPIGGQ